jgi:TetR/AcrR family transcriptional regulator, transcriptional repressor for nem operon
MRTRRVGSETSKTRALLLDGTERVMLEDGYAAVTYRSVAETADVTPALVQYYFPTIDHLFLAVLRRRSDLNHERLLSALQARPEEPLAVAWEFSTDETAASLLLEFMALANHRKEIRAAILDVISQTRKVQLEVIRANWGSYADAADGLSPEALLFFLHGIPKVVQLEESLGLTTAHYEILQYVQRRLATVEPAGGRGVGSSGMSII